MKIAYFSYSCVFNACLGLMSVCLEFHQDVWRQITRVLGCFVVWLCGDTCSRFLLELWLVADEWGDSGTYCTSI